MEAVEETVFIDVVAPGRIIILRWAVPHLGLYGQEEARPRGPI